MHLCPGNVVAPGRAVVYYARAAHINSTGIKCRHCITTNATQALCRILCYGSSFHLSAH